MEGVNDVIVSVVLKWIQGSDYKTWTRLFAFYIALISLGRVWTKILFRYLLVNSETDRAL